MGYDVLSLYGHSSALDINRIMLIHVMRNIQGNIKQRSHYVSDDESESLIRVELPVKILYAHNDRRHAIKRWMKGGRIEMESYRNK